MQTKNVLSLAIVTVLLCVCNVVTGYWLPNAKPEKAATLDATSDGDVRRTSISARNTDGTNTPWPQSALRNPVAFDVEAKTTNVNVDEFKILGGEAQSRPCCTSWGPGRVDCFIRGPKSNVFHISIENGKYSDWEDLGGIIVDEIECVSRDVGIIDVLVLGINIALYVKTYSSNKWSQWESKAGRLNEVPSCVVRTPSAIDCVQRMEGSRGYNIGAVDGKWTSYVNLGGILFDPIGCSSRDATHVNCFAAGMNLQLWTKFWIEGQGWKGWKPLGGSVKGRPSVVTWDENRIDVFSLGVRGNSIMQRTFKGEWQAWIDLGGVFESEPECLTTGVGKLHCFAIGAKSYLYKNDYIDGEWSGWTSTETPFLEQPSCVVSNKNEVSCYLRGFSKKVIEVVYKYD